MCEFELLLLVFGDVIECSFKGVCEGIDVLCVEFCDGELFLVSEGLECVLCCCVELMLLV